MTICYFIHSTWIWGLLPSRSGYATQTWLISTQLPMAKADLVHYHASPPLTSFKLLWLHTQDIPFCKTHRGHRRKHILIRQL